MLFLTRRPQLAGCLIACTALLASGASQAAEYPTRPIHVVSPYAPGNTLDTPLLVFGDYLRQTTGQQLLIEHKPGAAGIVATQAVANAPADGYTVLLGPMGAFTTNPFTYKSLPYSPTESFRPVTNFMGAPLLLVATADFPANTLDELIEYGRQHPGQPAYASFQAGNSSHFAGAILNKTTGMSMLHVPYNGTPPQVQALLGGQVETAFMPLIAAKPHIDSGKLKVLAYTGSARSNLMPDVPTFTELGHPELEINMWSGLFVPANTPDDVVARLNELAIAAMNSQPMLDRVLPYDLHPKPLSPAAFAEFIVAERQRWGEAVKMTGFTIQD